MPRKKPVAYCHYCGGNHYPHNCQKHVKDKEKFLHCQSCEKKGAACANCPDNYRSKQKSESENLPMLFT